MVNCMSPMDAWRLWVEWGGVTSNRRPPHGYIWTPHPFALAPVGMSNNHCHLETEVSCRAHIVGLYLGIVFYCTTSNLHMFMCTYILHSTSDTIIHCNHFCLLEMWDRVLNTLLELALCKHLF